MDWFSEISDWKDEESFSFKDAKIYRVFSGILKDTPYGDVYYQGKESDWNVLGYTHEENMALGRLFEIRETKFNIVCAGTSEENALEHLRRGLEWKSYRDSKKK